MTHQATSQRLSLTDLTPKADTGVQGGLNGGLGRDLISTNPRRRPR